MDTVFLRSGKVVCVCGTPVTDSTGKISSYTGVTSTGVQTAHYKDSPWSTFQATVSGTGAVTATVVIQCSNDNVNWCDTAMGTITLSGTTSDSDGIATVAPWKFIRVNITALTGTGAAVVVLMGV